MILVTGATGAIGPVVVHTFRDSGFQIRTLSLDPIDPGVLPCDVEILIGDVTDFSAVKAAMENVDTVVHLAALLHIVNPSPALRKKYEEVNVGGTANVIKAATQVRVKHVIFFSTISVYGDSGSQVLKEDSPPRPDTFYAQTKLTAERIVLNAKRSDGQPLGTVLRFGAIYGAGFKGNYRRLVQSLARGRFVPIGDGCNRRTLIYDQDVAQAAVLATQHPAAAGKIFNVSDGQFHTMTEIIATICKVLGRKPPRISLPVGPVRFAAGMVEDVAHLVGFQSPIARSTIDKYVEDVAVDSTRIQKELGFQPKYDLLSGWQKAVQEMRQMGNL